MSFIKFWKFLLFFPLFISLNNSKSPQSKSDLGRKLFFDKRLSANNKLSCASCHKPEFAFADTVDFSLGVNGMKGKRNTPSAMNMSAREIFFFDGRAKTLEEQATFPIQDHNEMDILMSKAVRKIAEDKNYIQWFQTIYQSKPNKDNILNAIAEFERSLETTSPFDQWMAGDSTQLSTSQLRGHKLFMDPKNKCFDCHFTPDFTGDEFRNIGLFDGEKWNDSGRYLITKNITDLGKFKVPGLRNVAITAPYMHNGRIKTLQEVIKHYDNIRVKVPNPINEDSLVQKPLNLSDQDIIDLEQFLNSLTDPQFKSKIHAQNTHHRRRIGRPATKIKIRK